MCWRHGGSFPSYYLNGVDRMHTVLLTAAVKPDSQYAVSVSQPAERLAMYQAAVSNWWRFCQSTGRQLLVVETSGASREAFLANLPQNDGVAFVNHFPSQHARYGGKGAAEAEALDAAVDTIGVEEGHTLTKVTGRLILENPIQVLKDLEPGVAVVRRTLDRRYVDTRLFSMAVGTWMSRMKGMSLEVDEGRGRYLEHVFAHRLVEAEYAGDVEVHRFPKRPRLVGRSGTSNARYDGAINRLRERAMEPMETLLARGTRKQV